MMAGQVRVPLQQDRPVLSVRRKHTQGSRIAKLQLGRNPADPDLHPHREIRGTRTFADGLFLNSTRVASNMTCGGV